MADSQALLGSLRFLDKEGSAYLATFGLYCGLKPPPPDLLPSTLCPPTPSPLQILTIKKEQKRDIATIPEDRHRSHPNSASTIVASEMLEGIASSPV